MLHQLPVYTLTALQKLYSRIQIFTLPIFVRGQIPVYLIFTHLKSWVAVARHNFKWVKIYSASPASCPPSAYCLCLWRRQLCRLIVVPWLCFQIKTLSYTKTCRNCAIIVVSIIMTLDLITVEVQVEKHKITCTPIMTIANNSQTNKGNKIGTGCW